MKIEKEILYRYFNGDATPEEEHKIRQYLEASDENWKEYLRERKFFDTIILKEQVVSEEKQMCRSSSVPSGRSCGDRRFRMATNKKCRSSCFWNGIFLEQSVREARN